MGKEPYAPQHDSRKVKSKMNHLGSLSFQREKRKKNRNKLPLEVKLKGKHPKSWDKSSILKSFSTVTVANF